MVSLWLNEFFAKGKQLSSSNMYTFLHAYYNLIGVKNKNENKQKGIDIF